MMRLLRAVIALLFVATLGLFGWTLYLQMKADKTLPVISIEGDLIEVPLNASETDLLAGVTAYDEKDGDLTEHVIVESISKFTETGVCKVYYAVCDHDDHVASAFRKIRYQGYTSPRFSMDRALCYSQMESVNVADVISATDVLDGDISGNIILTSSDYEFGVTGAYSVKAEVSNSKGDQISLSLPLFVEDRSLNAPEITLSSYLIYVPKGTQIDPRTYFISAKDSYDKDISNTLFFENDYRPNEPGVYCFHYFAADELGRQGHSVLTVVVE